jgi:hypothetical protein
LVYHQIFKNFDVVNLLVVPEMGNISAHRKDDFTEYRLSTTQQIGELKLNLNIN